MVFAEGSAGCLLAYAAEPSVPATLKLTAPLCTIQSL
jgi:hypothetical protein